jgi:leucyl aminopeptidase
VHQFGHDPHLIRIAVMPKISLVAPSTALTADAVVIGVLQGTKGPELASGAGVVDDALGASLLEALEAAGATGKPDEVVMIPTLGLARFPLVAATGIGPKQDDEAVRRAVGAALRGLTSKRTVHVAIDGSVAALAEGAGFGAYSFTEYKSTPPPTRLRTVTIAGANDKAGRDDLRRAAAVTDAVEFVRDLVNTPPNDLYPATFAERVEERATKDGLAIGVFDERMLKRGKFGAILAVGSGSSRPPRLVRLTHKPPRPVARVALVGKGITFDSGGLSLKPAKAMETMKSDMAGGATALHAVSVAAALGLPLEVTAYVPATENLPGGRAQKPGDVIRYANGKTVEVLNTDAEGRLVLADALLLAARARPDVVIDLATLTGAARIALGSLYACVLGNDQSLVDELLAASRACGEGLWQLPLIREYREDLKSGIADLRNVGSGDAGTILGALFLGEFVDGVPWAHLDIAGAAFADRELPLSPRGATGYGLRLLIEYLRSLTS